MQTRIAPVDILSLAFIAFLSSLVLFFADRFPAPGWLLLRYGLLLIAIVALTGSVRRQDAADAGHAMLLRDFFPILVILVIFDSMGDVIPWVRPALLDPHLIRIDFALFGVHPTVWMERFIRPWLTTVLQFAYISYYPMAIILAAVLVRRRRQEHFDEAVFGLVLCFYLSYIGYLLVPAVGPRFSLQALQTRDLAAGPVVTAIQTTLNALENTKMDAFPSGHTAIALTTLYYSWRTGERLLAGILVPVVSGLILSTVYLRYHYVIDVLAGICLAGLTVAVAPRLRRSLLRASGGPGDQFHEPA